MLNGSEYTFRKMFLQACDVVGIDFNMLPKDLCYSFVLQHPKNCIVTPIADIALYLIAAYKINNDTYCIEEQSQDCIKDIIKNTTIKIPECYSFTSYITLRKTWASYDTSHIHQGIIIKHIETGTRTKIRNPTFEYIRKLRGNQAKLQFRYLQPRKSCMIKAYLHHYKEHADVFNTFRDQVHAFTSELHDYYLKLHIHKMIQVADIPKQFRHHVYALHNIYRNKLRPINHSVQKYIVIEYVNTLPAAKLMWALNTNIKKSDLIES